MPGRNSKHPRPRSSRRAPLLRQAPPITPSRPLLDSLIQSHNAIVALVAKLSLQPRFEHASIPGYHRGRGGEWTKTKNKKRNRRKRKNKKKDAAPGSNAPSSSTSPPQPDSVRIPASSPPVPVPTSPKKKADHAQSMSTTLPATSSSSSSFMSHFHLVEYDGESFGCCPNCEDLKELSGLECCIECDYCSTLFAVSDRCRCEHLESFCVDMSDPNWQSQIPTSFPHREVLGQKLPASYSSSSSSSSLSTLKRPALIPPDTGTPSKKFHADSKEKVSFVPPRVSGGATSTSITAPPQWRTRVLHSEPSNPIQDHGPDDPLVWKDF